MEEKKFQKRHSSIWAISSSLYSLRSLFWRKINIALSKNSILNKYHNIFRSFKLDYSTSHLQSGFTLIEIITGIGIIAILATIAFTALNPIEQFRKAQDSKRKSDLAQVQRALESYYQDFGRYPAFTGCCNVSNAGEFPYTINTQDGEEAGTIEWGETWAPYIDVLPVEPNAGKFYVYWADDDNEFQSYRLYTALDRGPYDESACNDGLACQNIPSGIGGCGLNDEICNYGVTSPNISP